MKSITRFITYPLIFTALFCQAQVDGNLNTIGLEDFKHFSEVNFKSGEVEYGKIKKGDAEVRLFKPLFLVKGKGEWFYDADSCSIKKIQAIKMSYLAEGTKAIYCGLSFDAGVKNRKTLRGVSYAINNELAVGDTLRFTLTLLADRNKKFQPLIYLSDKLKSKRGKLKNGKHMQLVGSVPVGSAHDQDLVITTVELPITEELASAQWVHIVNNEDAMHKGFIIENDYQEGDITVEQGFRKVFFGNDSYTINKVGRQLLDSIAENKDTTTCISLRGYADPSGDKNYNLRLAKKRASAVEKYLLKKGVDRDRLVIEHVDILHNEKAADNRICTILVL